MKLSIAMIVKNEEINIERTLIPLKQLNNYINTEIVIVDTGSTDKTVDIAKKYTDKIYFYKWNNNFAEMRNISIEYCTGDWILIVDADEVLYDVKELVELIKDENFNKYNAAFIKIIDFNKNIEYCIKNGSITPMLRLFKKDNVEYKRIVHEQPECKGPFFETNIRFVHYGYDGTDSKLMEYKFERNLKLLLNELNNNSKDIYTNFQIATSYTMHGDFKDALKYIDIAYNQAKGRLSEYIYIIDKYCLILYKNAEYELLLEKANEGIKYCKDFIDFYFYLGMAFSNLNKYKQSINAYNIYLEYYENENVRFNSTLSICTKEYKNYVLYNLALSYYKLNFYEQGLNTLSAINDKNLLKNKLLLMLKIILEGKMYNKINIINEFIDINNYEQILLYMHKDVLLDDLKMLNKITLEDSIKEIFEIVKYFRENKTINEQYKEKIKKIIDYNKIPYSIYIYYLLKYDIEEINYLMYYGKDKMEDILLGLCSTYYEFNEIILDGLEKIKSDNLNNMIIKTIMQRAVILVGNISVDKKKNLFLNYIAEKYHSISKLYKSEIIRTNIWILTSEERFIVELKNTLSYKYKDTLIYIKSMKSVLNLEKSYTKYIELLIESETENTINKDIKAFIPQLVKSIEQLIYNENYQEAYNTVEQGLALVKFDFDLMVLKYNLLLNFGYKKEAEECFKNIILYGECEKVIELLEY
ncbi:glycosyltransferase family 2 protein [Clostridium sp. ZBS13]|uniref:glycosyltransferase family 2 protein n=1 Tax=Clostridium sp. ZBS13 TaxID=2949971 RepID=UPI00207AF9DE|nr:glycosyltransferase family 2 protein [Clostridium sp. ZBS13]